MGILYISDPQLHVQIFESLIIIIIIIIFTCLLQLSCHSVAAVLTLVQTKQNRINMHKRYNTKTQYKQYKAQEIHVHILPKHPPTHQPTHTHTHSHTRARAHAHTHTHTHSTKPTHTWSDNKVRELIAVKVLHTRTSFLKTTAVAFKELPLCS
jgi:ABC-type Zn2+ transport system substrate-binding protein/surface adhesin